MAKEFPDEEKCTISLVGFDSLDETEIPSIKKILAVYMQKLENKVKNASLKIRLRMHQHEKSFVHELEADLFVSGKRNFSVSMSHKNLYKALASTMSKLISELDHYMRKEK